MQILLHLLPCNYYESIEVIIVNRGTFHGSQGDRAMIFNKGEFGLYDCRERPVGGRMFLVFIIGLICGVTLMVCLFFIVTNT